MHNLEGLRKKLIINTDKVTEDLENRVSYAMIGQRRRRHVVH